MKIYAPKLKVDFEEINKGLREKIDGIFTKYTAADPMLATFLKEVIDVSIANGKTTEALNELEAHWEKHLGRAWVGLTGNELTYLMLFSLGQRMGIVYL